MVFWVAYTMKKIVHVITGLGVGGAETFLLRLIPCLRGADYESTVIYLTGQGEYASAYREKGISVIPLELNSPKNVFSGVLRLLKILREESPDLINTWMYHANLLGGVAGKVMRIPVIWNVRQSNLSNKVNKANTLGAIRISAPLSRVLPFEILYNSEAARAAHKKIGFRHPRSRVLINGVDESIFSPSTALRVKLRSELGIPDDAPIVGHVARYDIQKDHETFLRAVGIVRLKRHDLHVVMIGAGVEWKNERLTQSLAYERDSDWLHLLGPRENMRELYSAMDIFCSSSIGESFPNAVLEAMMMALPCVVTDVGDSRRIVGEGGSVIAPADYENLARELLRVVSMRESQRKKIGLAMRALALERFTLSKAANSFVECFDEVTNNSKSK